MVEYHPQKDESNRVQLTVGGNLITYPGDVNTRTADLKTSKILWNKVLSTAWAKYMCIDIKNFYLFIPIGRYGYIGMKLTDFPMHVQHKYNLQAHANNGYVYLKIWRSIYSLPQVGKLALKYLQDKIGP